MAIENNDKFICPQCRFVGSKERFSRGCWKLEILLWSMLFIPGAIYTTWRYFNEYFACPICKNEAMTPLGSTLGQKLLKEKDRMDTPMTKGDMHRFLKKLFYGK